MDTCRKCGGLTVKNGSVKGVAKRKCKACGFQSGGWDNRGKPPATRLLGIVLYAHGLSLSTVGKLLGVSATAVMKWVKSAAERHAMKPEPGHAVIVELDEMWHFLTFNQTLCFFGTYLSWL